MPKPGVGAGGVGGGPKVAAPSAAPKSAPAAPHFAHPAIHPPTPTAASAGIKVPAPKAAPAAASRFVHPNSGGGAPLASITDLPIIGPITHAVESAGSAVGHEAALWMKQALASPHQMLVGAESIGGAMLHDASTGHLDLTNPVQMFLDPSSSTGSLMRKTLTTDPVVQSIREGSLKPALQQPFATSLDALAGYGVIGKGAGAFMRSGAVGDRAAALADMGGRAPRQVLPDVGEATQVPAGAPGAVIDRGYSSNVITKALQVQGDKMPMPKVQVENWMRKMIAQSHTAARGALTTDLKTVHDGLEGAKPKGKEEAAVANMVIPTGQNTRAGFALLRENMDKSMPGRDPDFLRSRAENSANLDAAIAKDQASKLDRGSLTRAAEAYKPLREMVDQKKVAADMIDSAHARRAEDIQRALIEPDVFKLDHPVRNPHLEQLVDELRAAKREAAQEARTAKSNRDAYAGTPNQRGAYRAWSATHSDLQRRLPLTPANDNLQTRMIEDRRAIDNAHPLTRAYHEMEVKRTKLEFAKATKNLSRAETAVRQNKIDGTVIRDDSMPAVRSGRYAGERIRPLTQEDVEGMRYRDVSPQSFVHTTNPERAGAHTLSDDIKRDVTLVPAQSGRAPLSGEALQAGDFRPGWSALGKGLRDDLFQIHTRNELQGFFDRWSIPNQEGILRHPTLADAKITAEDYKDRTGISAVPRQDFQGTYRVLPQAAVKELGRQFRLDRPSTAAKMLTKPNIAFSRTVLAFSPKLWIMHPTEDLIRTAAIQGDPLRAAIRAPLDYIRGRQLLQEGPTAALNADVTHGSLSRAGMAGEDENLGRVPVDRSMPSAAFHGFMKGMNDLSTTIIRGQRMFEKIAQTSALGASARQMYQEMGHNWFEANTSFRALAREVGGEMHASPELVDRAARDVNYGLGQYNAFTANTRVATRFVPFGSWYMNAAKFVLYVMPKDHPLFTSLLNTVARANQQEWNAEHTGLPPDMSTDVPFGGPGGWLEPGKFMPIIPSQNVAATVSQLVMPWVTGPALALAGKNSFMQDLKGPGVAYGQGSSPEGVQSTTQGGISQAENSALEQILEQFGGPLDRIATALYSHGGTFYNTDEPVLHLASLGNLGSVAVKPGSASDARGPLPLPAALDKALDPFHPTTYAPKSASSGSSNPFSNSGFGSAGFGSSGFGSGG